MDLIIVACQLLATEAGCREYRVPMSVEQTDMTACTRAAMFVIPSWQARHPEVQVDHWRCMPARRS